MSIAIRHLFSKADERWEVKIIGDIDINTSVELKERLVTLLDEKDKSMIINIEEVDYLDSTGLGMFIAIVKRIKQSGNELIFVNPKPAVNKLFEITGLDQVFTLRQYK